MQELVSVLAQIREGKGMPREVGEERFLPSEKGDIMMSPVLAAFFVIVDIVQVVVLQLL